MREKIECDILIVGAGPAGSRAAAATAQAGYSVLLIDAKLRIGEQPHCGEFVPARLFSEFELDRSSIVQNVAFMETRILDASNRVASATVLKFRRIQSPGFMIDRIRFDRSLARKAAYNGATVMCATRLIGRENSSWVIQSRGKKSLVRSRLTIAADGAASKTAAVLGMKRPDLLKGVQVEVPLSSPLEDTYVFLVRNFLGGYGWLFPKRTTANVGIGVVPRSGLPASRLLERFLDGLHRSGMIKPGRLAMSAGLIPVSGLRENLVMDDVIFCGDAAGLTHPITGAGIPQAVFSGELAGSAAAAALRNESREPLAEYQNEIRGTYNGIINHALSKRAYMMQSWNDQDFVATCEQTWIGFEGYRKRVR